MNRIVKAGLLAVAAIALTGGARAYDNCTPQVTIVYGGATAINNTINIALNTLLAGGTANTISGSTWPRALSDCTGNITAYQALLNGVCVRAYVTGVASPGSAGSCEGLQQMDALDNTNVQVCTATANSTTKRLLTGLTDETGAQLHISFAGSDVNDELCATVNGPYGRVDSLVYNGNTLSGWGLTDDLAFVNPFAMIINRNIESALPASKTINPPNPAAQCPYQVNSTTQVTPCPRLDFGLTQNNIQSIYGLQDVCDWRQLGLKVNPSARIFIGKVNRTAISGTRRLFMATNMLPPTTAIGTGTIFQSSTGNVRTRVAANGWCGTNATECHEVCSGGTCTYGSGTVAQNDPACNALSNQGYSPVSIGEVGVDSFVMTDPGTPTDPFDDYPVRGTNSQSYDVLAYNGEFYNPSKVRCGRYEWWSNEHLYYDPVYFSYSDTLGRRLPALNALIAQIKTNAAQDPNVVAYSSMYVSRATDGGPITSTSGYNTFCNEP